jgi:hypothetical protein
MLSIALSDVRDLVVVLWGFISILLTLILLVIAAGIFWFGRKSMSAAHRALNKQGVESLSRVQKLADKLRDRTAKLPGAPGSQASAAELVSTVQEIREMDPPFRRKVKSWRPF